MPHPPAPDPVRTAQDLPPEDAPRLPPYSREMILLLLLIAMGGMGLALAGFILLCAISL